MLEIFSIVSIAIAGASMLWRNIYLDHNRLQNSIVNLLPATIANALACGFCFTYWLTLVLVVFIDPLPGLGLPLNDWVPDGITWILLFFVKWLALAITALIIRNIAVALQELVIYQYHVIHKQIHDHE